MQFLRQITRDSEVFARVEGVILVFVVLVGIVVVVLVFVVGDAVVGDVGGWL